MLGYLAIGKILNAETKGIIGYKFIRDGKNEVYLRLKDVKTLAKNEQIVNIDYVRSSDSVVLTSKEELLIYYYTKDGIVSAEEYEEEQEKLKVTIEKSKDYSLDSGYVCTEKDIELREVECDNGDCRIKIRFYGEAIKSVKCKVDKDKDYIVKDGASKFKGVYLDVICGEDALADLVDSLCIYSKSQECAVRLYIKDEEYVGEYIESERKIDWLSKNSLTDKSLEEGLCIMVQGICDIISNA